MSLAIIRKAFETRLKTWADAQTPVIPVAWQNVGFTPPVGRYLKFFLLPADTQSRWLERTDREYRGVAQVSLYMPIGTGPSGGDALAASLDAAFAHTFTEGGLRLFLTRPWSAAPAIQEPDRYIVPVSTAYRVPAA